MTVNKNTHNEAEHHLNTTRWQYAVSRKKQPPRHHTTEMSNL